MQIEQQSSGAENVCDEQKLPNDILNAKLPACSKECFVKMLSQVQFDQGCGHLHTMVLQGDRFTISRLARIQSEKKEPRGSHAVSGQAPDRAFPARGILSCSWGR